jgi:uncharacterized Rmd1/YagE family protein
MNESPLSGSSAFKARAVLLGERIDLRAWGTVDALATAPLTVAVRGGGVAVLFRYGVTVFFNVSPVEEVAFLSHLGPLVANAYETPETEEVEIRIDPGAKEGVKGGAVYLENAEIERLQLIADVLSKSVTLALYESRLAAGLDRIEPFAMELERTGRIAGKAKDLVRDIGAMLLSEQRMVGRAEMLEKPETLWDHPALEGLFARLEDEFEIRERYGVLERKLTLISHTAQTLLELLQNRHALRVEWYIVILIAAEICLSLYDLFFR